MGQKNTHPHSAAATGNHNDDTNATVTTLGNSIANTAQSQASSSSATSTATPSSTAPSTSAHVDTLQLPPSVRLPSRQYADSHAAPMLISTTETTDTNDAALSDGIVAAVASSSSSSSSTSSTKGVSLTVGIMSPDASNAASEAQLTAALQFASLAPPALLRQSSAATFSALHSSLSASTPIGSTRRLQSAVSSPKLSPKALSTLSDAIHTGLTQTQSRRHSITAKGSESFDQALAAVAPVNSAESTPATVEQTTADAGTPRNPHLLHRRVHSRATTLLTEDVEEQKAILLRSLFQAIDQDANGYVEREELLVWVENEPWLQQDGLKAESERLLQLVTHDEDSRCSRNEFLAAFERFTTAEIITLVVNLLRAGMISKLPKLCYVYNTHDPYWNGIHTFDQTGQEHSGDFTSSLNTVDPNQDDVSHPQHRIHADTPANSFMHFHSRDEAAKHFFLLDLLFQAIDRDLDGKLDVKDLQRWLRADPWIHEEGNEPIFEAVDSCWRELCARNAEENFFLPPEEPLSVPPPSGGGAHSPRGVRPSTSSSALSSAQTGPARLEEHFFLMMFSQCPKKLIRKLLVHLLSRNASNVMDDAQKARMVKKRMSGVLTSEQMDAAVLAAAHAQGADIMTPKLENPMSPGFNQMLSPLSSNSLSTPSTLVALPSYPYPLIRRHSVVVGGSQRPSVADGLRITLVGQSMVQHDLRQFEWGQRMARDMRPLLKADVVFTELETALIREGMQGTKTRNTVFFHAATPDVIDVLTEMDFNMFAASNNHAGDLGEEGLRVIMEEFQNRNLCMAGIGLDAKRATRAAFLDTPNGRIAQICFASKIPEASIATDSRPGVNHLSMLDLDTQTLNPVDLNRILAAIEEAREGFVDPITLEPVRRADMVVVYHHNHVWEKNQTVNTDSEGAFGNWKRELAHTLIDAGAHIYVAHGDPRLQGIEIYKSRPIFFCLGNFIFQTKTEISFYGAEVWQSVIVQIHCNELPDNETSYSVKLIPIVLNEKGETEANHFQTRGLPKLANGRDGTHILTKLQKMSARFGTIIKIEQSIEGDEQAPVIGWVICGNKDVLSTPTAAVASAVNNKNPLQSPASTSSAASTDSISPDDDSKAPVADGSEMSKKDAAHARLLRELSPQVAVFPDS